jgi:DNA polymerase alpha subunit A
MYGCLGFSNSRFFAQPIAALVTAMGRETLQRAVDIAQETVGLEVIHGDTDSIMINTRINDPNELKTVEDLGEKVKKEVHRLYKMLELEIDGIFRSMLLLKKKKYAAVTVGKGPNGEPVYAKEMKGLDLVRRDWCVQSKDTGRFVLDRILSREDKETVIKDIYDHLEALAQKMRSGELPLDKYVITKGLSKHPNDYPDAKSQPHVHVAKMMLKENRPVNTGDHIPY